MECRAPLLPNINDDVINRQLLMLTVVSTNYAEALPVVIKTYNIKALMIKDKILPVLKKPDRGLQLFVSGVFGTPCSTINYSFYDTEGYPLIVSIWGEMVVIGDEPIFAYNDEVLRVKVIIGKPTTNRILSFYEKVISILEENKIGSDKPGIRVYYTTPRGIASKHVWYDYDIDENIRYKYCNYDEIDQQFEEYFNDTITGLILLKGPKGTGKTRYLINKVKQHSDRIWEAYIGEEAFYEGVPDSLVRGAVIVYEDAEKLLEDRLQGGKFTDFVLNLSDGFINANKEVKFIFTINIDKKIDEAVLRPGRSSPPILFKELPRNFALEYTLPVVAKELEVELSDVQPILERLFKEKDSITLAEVYYVVHSKKYEKWEVEEKNKIGFLVRQ